MRIVWFTDTAVSASVVQQVVDIQLIAESHCYYYGENFTQHEADAILEEDGKVDCIVVFEEVGLWDLKALRPFLRRVTKMFPDKPILWIRSSHMSVVSLEQMPSLENIHYLDIDRLSTGECPIGRICNQISVLTGRVGKKETLLTQ